MKYLQQTCVKAKNDSYANDIVRSNEDAIRPVKEQTIENTPFTCFALSDGAGGVGVFASEWSAYLLEKLPETPFGKAEELDSWLGDIWEPFYEAYCPLAEKDIFLKRKFTDDGSFATLAAVWVEREKQVIHSCSYGDSWVFFYDEANDELHWRKDKKLASFQDNPYLLSLLKEITPEAYYQEKPYPIQKDWHVLLASDALSKYILLNYMLCKAGENAPYAEELQQLEQGTMAKGIEANRAATEGKAFYQDILKPLQDSLESQESFTAKMQALYEAELLDNDDYSLISISF